MEQALTITVRIRRLSTMRCGEDLLMVSYGRDTITDVK